MPDPTATISGPGPGPVRVGALERLLAELGRKETEGKNWGPFIRRMGAYFLSAARLASYAPGGARAGLLFWCALTVCGMIYEELLARGMEERARWWRREMASASCEELWAHLEEKGWAWRRGAPLPVALSPQGVSVPGLPGPGDLVFYGAPRADGSLDLHHVDFYKAPAGAGEDFDSAGGNTGPCVDAVDVVEHRGAAAVAKVAGYARLPI